MLNKYIKCNFRGYRCGTIVDIRRQKVEDNLQMASKGRNMQLSGIAIKYTLTGTFLFDYIPFPIFTHTKGMTHFLDPIINLYMF